MGVVLSSNDLEVSTRVRAMRKLLILPFVLVAVIYAAWPGWSAWQLRAAVKARDLAGIESRVDWPTLRSNFKQSIGAYLKEEGPNPDAGVFATLKRTLGPLVAGQIVEIAVTPSTLAFVLAGNSRRQRNQARCVGQCRGRCHRRSALAAAPALGLLRDTDALSHRGYRSNRPDQACGQYIRAKRLKLEAR